MQGFGRLEQADIREDEGDCVVRASAANPSWSSFPTRAHQLEHDAMQEYYYQFFSGDTSVFPLCMSQPYGGTEAGRHASAS